MTWGWIRYCWMNCSLNKTERHLQICFTRETVTVKTKMKRLRGTNWIDRECGGDDVMADKVLWGVKGWQMVCAKPLSCMLKEALIFSALSPPCRRAVGVVSTGHSPDEFSYELTSQKWQVSAVKRRLITALICVLCFSETVQVVCRLYFGLVNAVWNTSVHKMYFCILIALFF